MLTLAYGVMAEENGSRIDRLERDLAELARYT
jgi:hypothetical protein